MQRTKGHSYERWVVNWFKSLGFISSRNLNDVVDKNGIDVFASRGKLDIAIQCKRLKNYAPINRIFEINSEYKNRILLTKADRQEDMVVMPLSFLKELLDVRRE